MSAEMDVEAAIEVCERWFRYLERQKEKTLTLQKAANLARAGKADEARRIKAQVDSAPQVFDGAMLHPAVAALVDSARSQAEEIERLTEQVRVLEELSRDFQALQHALVGDTGASAIHKADALTRQLREAVEERDRYRESLERIRLRAAPGPDDRNFDRCIQDLMWCDDEARLALTNGASHEQARTG